MLNMNISVKYLTATLPEVSASTQFECLPLSAVNLQIHIKTKQSSLPSRKFNNQRKLSRDDPLQSFPHFHQISQQPRDAVLTVDTVRSASLPGPLLATPLTMNVGKHIF